MRGLVILLVLFFSLIGTVIGDSANIPLLAVSESEDGMIGSVANLNLEVTPGSGRLFMDTFPLSKLDTQLSTRFSRSYVCGLVDVDCKKKDFFYVITSSSNLVGGPSAGAAAAVLTYAVLTQEKFDNTIAITGTLNSGGLIGPVGSIREKIMAASEEGMSVVLIPAGEKIQAPDNTTVDPVVFGKSLDIEVIPVETFDDVLFIVFGRTKPTYPEHLAVPEDYTKRMRDIARKLCQNSLSLRMDIKDNDALTVNSTQYQDLYEDGVERFAAGQYYAAASYCYGSSLGYSRLLLLHQNLSREEELTLLHNLQNQVEELDKSISTFSLENINDLQTKMIVTERYIEAQLFLDQAQTLLKATNRSAVALLATARERLLSAKHWSSFFGMEGIEYSLDDDAMRTSCLGKIAEARERLSYVHLYFPMTLQDTEDQIARASRDYVNGDYELCFFKAAKAQAQANVVIGALGMKEAEIKESVSRKIILAREAIYRQQKKGLFPILSYSYAEYADALLEDDIYSSLLYAEYALEMSAIDNYLEKKRAGTLIDILRIEHRLPFIFVFLMGFFVGVLFMLPKTKQSEDKPLRAPPKRHSQGKKR